MILSFTLTMPNNNSWNGKWSGDNKLYVKTRSFSNTQKHIKKLQPLLDRRSFYYNFGDGWAANISIKQVDSKEAAKLRRQSLGFYGYDWMIDSILECGEIKPRTSMNT